MDFAALGFQAVPPAPGRQAPATQQPVQQAPAPAGEGAAPPDGGGLIGLFPLLIFIPLLLLLFWSSRSQQKKQEANISALKKGDRVVTQSGLVGRLAEIDQRYAKLELAPGVKVTILRSSLVGRDAEEPSAKKAEPAPEKKKA